MASLLTYRDVRTILALLDGWGAGKIHYRGDNLVVDAIVHREETLGTTSVLSPAVGIFNHTPTLTRCRERDDIVDAGAYLGFIDAPLKSTPVAVPGTARLLSVLVPNGTFVEYGQCLAVVALVERP